MQQVVQNLKNGKVELCQVPAPMVGRGEILVATRASLISAGTERMMMDFAGKSMLGKAKERPDLVRKVVDKMQRDGVVDTLKGVFGRLDEPLPLGYSASGVVVAVGRDAEKDFAVGDRVAVAGAGLANHADFNAVPTNLAVKLPENVPFEHGCYATLCAIAMHGVRNAGVGLGDRVLVIGLGLVGQLAVQIASAAGARVVGLDMNASRCALAVQGGAIEAFADADASGLAGALAGLTDGRGFDAVLICAASDSDAIVEQAAEWARDRATVVLVGKVGTAFPYASYMKKELTVKVSRSYGPGRYDPAFEKQGLAYPVGFVPWTERDNLAESVRLMAAGGIKPALLTSHTFDFANALDGYALLKDGKPCLGVVLHYPEQARLAEREHMEACATPHIKAKSGAVGVAIVGTGNFARHVLLPCLKNMKLASIKRVVSKGGLTAAYVANKFGGIAGTSFEQVLADPSVDAVVIATRHNLHAGMVLDALRAGKHVWVEKPLALSLPELEAIEAEVAARPKQVLWVGFNRRFSPHFVALRKKLSAVSGPKQVLIRVNAGRLPEGNDASWQHSAEGGGRLLGEVCHFTDLAIYLTRFPVVSVTARRGGGQDTFSLVLDHADGSQSTVVYVSEGDARLGKEYVEVSGGGFSGCMDNYARTWWSEHGKKRCLAKKGLLRGTDKGHRAALAAWLEACLRANSSDLGKLNALGVFGGEYPLAKELLHSSRVILAAEESVRGGDVVRGF